ncbi:tetratricopeptide repeat protein [Anseongella ginsenosidimutans]|uniref:histidine kinase n=1 Tax=Anseongella ginsenosidimutans TaxID=496056 RepID=A0A4R3KX48_9SPHI|nr:tetratricopeptide repeat protein [Anseongella ginsenosidimutans]
MPILIVSILFSAAARCQDTSVTDSLLRQLELSEADSSRVNTYLALWYQYYRSDNMKALEYAGKAKQLAEKIGYTQGQAVAAYRLGSQYNRLREFDKAKIEFNISIALAKSVNDSNALASALAGLARIHRENTAIDSATAAYLEAMAIFESSGDRNAVAMIHNDLGNLYKRQRLFGKALSHYKKALEIVRKLGFLPGISACLTNIGAVYQEQGKHDEALSFQEEALGIKREMGDKLGEARVLHELGNIHRLSEDYEKASDHFRSALELAEELSQQDLIAMARYSLGFNEFQRGNYREAIHYGELVAAQENKNLATMAENHEMLAGAYAALNDFEQGYGHSVLAKKYDDSLYNEQRITLSSELEAKYQNEKNQKEIASLNAAREINILKLQKQRSERIYLIGGAILVFLLGIVIWNRYRIKARTNKKLREMDQVKSRFFANISHEFRTPLTLILGPLQELQKKDFHGDKQSLYQVMQRNSRGLLHMVDQLLDLSKIESDKMVLQAVKTDLRTFLKPVTAAYESLAQSREIRFDFKMEDDIDLYIDPEKMEKILHNILSNAFKFTGKGGSITLSAGVSDFTQKQQAQVSIKDTGIGIAPQELSRIFDRFFQAGNGSAQQYKGTGIGLALTKELVTLHHGEIDVSSVSGQGSCFTILLPMGKAHLSRSELFVPANSPAPAEPGIISGSSFPATESRHSGSTISRSTISGRKKSPAGETRTPEGAETEHGLPQLLIVEDNIDMQAFLGQILKPHYRVSAASNGLEGLEKARELQPDLLLSDVMMPEMDGIELCRRLKLDENTSHIPVILLTARSGKIPRIEGLETGADDYLTKPFDADELLVLLKNRIRQRALLRERFSREITLQPKDITITSADERFLQKAMDIVESNMGNFEFNVQAFIEQIGLGRTQVERKLKALTGQTPVEFIRLLRLKRAAQKIAGKEDSISQIAYSVGFNNLSYFAKCFKEQFGESPSAWSKQPA